MKIIHIFDYFPHMSSYVQKRWDVQLDFPLEKTRGIFYVVEIDNDFSGWCTGSQNKCNGCYGCKEPSTTKKYHIRELKLRRILNG